MIIDFSLKVGVFYKDEEWMQEKADGVINDLTDSEIKYHKRAEHGIIKIWINDYCLIEFVPVNIFRRGNRYSRIFYQMGINKEIVNSLIRPHLLGENCWEID